MARLLLAILAAAAMLAPAVDARRSLQTGGIAACPASITWDLGKKAWPTACFAKSGSTLKFAWTEAVAHNAFAVTAKQAFGAAACPATVAGAPAFVKGPTSMTVKVGAAGTITPVMCTVQSHCKTGQKLLVIAT